MRNRATDILFGELPSRAFRRNRQGDPPDSGRGRDRAGGGSPYEAEANALFARFTTPPTTARKGLINTLIKTLKTSGVWQKLDAFYILAAADAQAARRNWIGDVYNLTAVAAPTFTADRGYQGDGSTSYLETSFAAATAGGKYALNDASIFAWSRSNTRVNSSPIIGSAVSGSGRVFLNPWNSTVDSVGHSINDGGSSNAFAPGAADGLFTLVRSSSAGYDVYRNSTALGNQVQVSVSLPANGFRILSTQGNFTNREVAVGGFGQGLTPQNVADLHSAVNTYLVAVGAA